MVGPLRNSSKQVLKTNMHMHTNKDISEIRQITIGKGTRVVKEVMMGMMVTRGPAGMAGMELVVTMVAMSQVMTKTRAMIMMGLVTTTRPVTTKVRMA